MNQNTDKDSGEHVPVWWHPIWEFLVHAVVGTTLFICIAFPAVGLNYVIHQLESAFGLNAAIIYSMKFVEYAILGSDLVLFSVFIFRSVLRTIRNL